jgi:hypothetical protein
MPAGTNPLAIRPGIPVSAPPARVQLFCAACAGFAMAYGSLELEPSPIMVVLLNYGPLFVVIAWLAAETRRRIVDAYDLGLFFYVTWPVTLIWYAVRSRGLAGWTLAIRLYVLVLAGQLGFILGRTLRFFLVF